MVEEEMRLSELVKKGESLRARINAAKARENVKGVVTQLQEDVSALKASLQVLAEQRRSAVAMIWDDRRNERSEVVDQDEGGDDAEDGCGNSEGRGGRKRRRKKLVATEVRVCASAKEKNGDRYAASDTEDTEDDEEYENSSAATEAQGGEGSAHESWHTVHVDENTHVEPLAYSQHGLQLVHAAVGAPAGGCQGSRVEKVGRARRRVWRLCPGGE